MAKLSRAKRKELNALKIKTATSNLFVVHKKVVSLEVAPKPKRIQVVTVRPIDLFGSSLGICTSNAWRLCKDEFF